MEDMEQNIVAVAEDVQRNSADISTLATIGYWCAEQISGRTVGTITYDRITYSNSNNMNIATTPLDINTGNYSHNCYYYLDIDICHISGIFTVPVSGAWRLSYSMRSAVESGEYNLCYLFINGNLLLFTEHYTYSENGNMGSTGGRVVTLEASAGDEIEVRTTHIGGDYLTISFCAEFIPKM